MALDHLTASCGKHVPNNKEAADKTIFVVDDDSALLRSLYRLLKAHGFSPRTFESAEAFCASANPDEALCLVLDINLNGHSGIELCRQLTASGSSLPIILITGNDAERVRKEALDAGCLAYLQKPFSAQSLLQAIGKAATFRKSSDPAAMFGLRRIRLA
jgi:FixJ family two-component response regulator